MNVIEQAIADSELIAKVKRGDDHAFQELFQRYHGQLFKMIHFRTRDFALAQDIVQEAFVRVWNHRESLKADLTFFAYIARIAQNLVQDNYKHQQVRVRHADHVKVLTDRPVSNPEQDLHLTGLQSRIREVVEAAIPKKCREIFALSRGAGLSNQEIADYLDISKKTVENQLHTALKILRQKCSEYL